MTKNSTFKIDEFLVNKIYLIKVLNKRKRYYY